jgi:hypothetical protein
MKAKEDEKKRKKCMKLENTKMHDSALAGKATG